MGFFKGFKDSFQLIQLGSVLEEEEIRFMHVFLQEIKEAYKQKLSMSGGLSFRADITNLTLLDNQINKGYMNKNQANQIVQWLRDYTDDSSKGREIANKIQKAI